LAGSVFYQSYYGTVERCSLAESDLAGKVVVVTGASDGIGYQTALLAAHRNARVIMGVRDPRKGQTARDNIVKATNSISVSVIGLDLSSMKKVHKFVDKVEQLYGQVDVLINNAAISTSQRDAHRQTTSEGLELVMATNHLGPLHLSRRILAILAADGKIITTSCESNLAVDQLEPKDLNSEMSYRPDSLYEKSKLLNIMMARTLAEKMSIRQSSFSLDPGFTWTNLYHNNKSPSAWLVWLLGPLFGANAAANSCRTAFWLAAAAFSGPGGNTVTSGQHYRNCAVSTKVNALADKKELRDQMWQASVDLVDSVLYV